MKQQIASVFILCTLTALAQEAPDVARPRDPEQGREKMRALEFWRKVDANRDQKLSKEEFFSMPRVAQLPQEKQDKLFARLDKDGSGFLEAQELIPSAPLMPRDGAGQGEMKRRPLPRIAEMDLNKDGKISFEEFLQAPMIAKLPEDKRRSMFDKMDRNQDGVLSPEDGPPPGQGMRRPEGRGEGRPLGRPPIPREGDPEKRPEDSQRRPQQNPAPPSPMRTFGAADANRDQVIDFTEFQQFPPLRHMGEDAQEDLFEKIDANKDLKIGQEEWESHWKANRLPVPHQHGGPSRPKRPQTPTGDEEMMQRD